MVQSLDIKHYRKLRNIKFTFSPCINIISGTNGTCKTSILHIVGNAFQKLDKEKARLDDVKCIEIISRINTKINPKIESLTKGDKKFNDPAYGTEGALFSVTYSDTNQLNFRKHNSRKSRKRKNKINPDVANLDLPDEFNKHSNLLDLNHVDEPLHSDYRYAIKPMYSKPGESLPELPVIYLGLSRLFPYGEYSDSSKNIRANLPDDYQSEIVSLYSKLSYMTIESIKPQQIGLLRSKFEFSTDKDGIDSNTISSGEDNLLIIVTALVSLKYYHNALREDVEKKEVESILLIDEFDASIHPGIQYKLLEILKEYTADYRIQIILTTHSISLLEYALEMQQNVIYLYDNFTSVVEINDPTIHDIRKFLFEQTKSSIFKTRKIPILTEDDEARLFLDLVLAEIKEIDPEFARIYDYFHFVGVKIGSPNLIGLFEDEYFAKSISPAICILDGDCNPDLKNHIITLPGKTSPEELIMDYVQDLFKKDIKEFWLDKYILQENIGKKNYIDFVLPAIKNIQETIQKNIANEQSNKGVKRNLNKKVFNSHHLFFKCAIKYWLRDCNNLDELYYFYNNLFIMFKKVAPLHGINSSLWGVKKLKEEFGR